jgi:hypothetical protein
VLTAAGLFLLERGITAQAHRMGDNAARDFGGEPAQALLRLAECEPCSMADRNHAVWALGQTGEESALPVLERLRTGKKCDHDRRLCEYELDKAIRKIKGICCVSPFHRLRRARLFRR